MKVIVKRNEIVAANAAVIAIAKAIGAEISRPEDELKMLELVHNGLSGHVVQDRTTSIKVVDGDVHIEVVEDYVVDTINFIGSYANEIGKLYKAASLLADLCKDFIGKLKEGAEKHFAKWK